MRSVQMFVAGGAAAGLVVLATTAASADPGGVRAYPGVGSETTQDVWNNLAGSGKIGSYDAFGSPTIKTTTNGPAFTRPAGSGEGVAALSAAVTDSTYRGVKVKGQVAWARSSSGPESGSGLTYLPFARDAVSVAYNVPSAQTGAAVVNLTKAELKEIFECRKTTIVVGGTTVKVNPKLPQTGSGTRKFFLKAAGAAEPAQNSCVKTVGAENNGSQIPADGDLIPFSAAQWTAQKNGVVTNTVSAADLKIATIDGKEPKPTASNSLYGDLTKPPATVAGVFARDTYNVIPTSQRGKELETLLNAGANNKATVEKFGFGKLSYVGSGYKTGGFTSKP